MKLQTDAERGGCKVKTKRKNEKKKTEKLKKGKKRKYKDGRCRRQVSPAGLV